jgi:hypothetical protein
MYYADQMGSNAMMYIHNKTKKQTLWLSIRQRTIPTDRPPLLGKGSANFLRIERCRVLSAMGPYGR